MHIGLNENARALAPVMPDASIQAGHRQFGYRKVSVNGSAARQCENFPSKQRPKWSALISRGNQ